MAPRNTDSPLLFSFENSPDFSNEKRLIAGGCRYVAGTDEAGRGPLAGPVVAAAVILTENSIPTGLNDSKKLSEKAREALFDAILDSAEAVSISSISAAEIDRTDIRKASLEAMRRAVTSLGLEPEHVLADGRDVPLGLSCGSTALIKGDGRSVSIAAASIVAKVTRDRMMKRLCPHHSTYGFSSHKGYGSLRHRNAIRDHGPLVRIHRYSFAPISKQKTRP